MKFKTEAYTPEGTLFTHGFHTMAGAWAYAVYLGSGWSVIITRMF